MNTEEKVLSMKRKHNMKLYSIHRMLTVDLLFYYAIKFIFLTQVKGISASDIVLASAFLGIFKVIFQIPTTVLIDKIGGKKSLIIADILFIISVGFVMICNSFAILLIASLLSGIAFAIKEVAENDLLNVSIPDIDNKNTICTKIDSKGLGNFFFISAVSGILSGVLYDVNPYIPMSVCILILLIALRSATLFYDIRKPKKDDEDTVGEEISEEYSTYLKDLKMAFSFIFNSKRLKALMLYAGIMFSLIIVVETYDTGLLQEIKLSATNIGIIYAIMQMIAGLASKKQNAINKAFSNKTLSVIGISYTLATLVAGAVAVMNINYTAIIIVILISYSIRYIGVGAYYALIKKYINNFTDVNIISKIYSAYGIVTGVGSTLIGILGSIIVRYNNLSISMIIFGLISTVLMLFVLRYMKKRIGLKPEDYDKKDIDYKEYIDTK